MMWKKIAVSLLLALLAIFALFQFQRAQFEQQIAQTLRQQSIQFKQVGLGFFPTPRVQIKQFTYPLDSVRSFSGEILQADFALLPLLMGKGKIEQIQLTNAQFADWSVINVQLKPTALYLSDLPALREYGLTGKRDTDNAKWQYRLELSARDSQNRLLGFTGHIQLNKGQIAVDRAELSFPLSVLFVTERANKRFRWNIENATFTQFNAAWYQFSSGKNHINGQDWGKLAGQLRLNNGQNEFLLQLENKQQLQLNWQNKPSWISLRSNSFPIEKLTSAVDFPKLFAGDATLNLLLWQNPAQQLQGKLNLSIASGELIGLNFAYLASNYLPLNFDEQSLSQANTAFQNLQTNWLLDKGKITMQSLSLSSKQIVLTGVGEANLNNQQCDFKISLSVAKPQFAQLKLPVHFWGSCAAPQYQIEVDSELRHQLKQLIKQKFK